jgi:hypothetical protein
LEAALELALESRVPDNAVVLSVDEKPSIEALERAQGDLKLPNGRAMTGQSHDYKRHGTTPLFAAMEVATGKVVGRHYRRRRRIEFLDFMNRIAAAYPDPSFTSSLGLPRNGGHLMESSQGSEVTNGDEDPAIIRGRVQAGGGVTADIEW